MASAASLDLSGIDNVGEFYSHHYLDTLLGSDLKATLDRWANDEETEGRRHPEKALSALSKHFYKELQEAQEAEGRPERWLPLRRFHAQLIEALGYKYEPTLIPLDDEAVLPVLREERRDGQPYLWIVDAPLPKGEDASPFDETWLPEQLGEDAPDALWLPRGEDAQVLSIADTLSEVIFTQDHPPRWVLFLAGVDAFLIERSKWAQGKYLRFRLGELFGRRQAVALRAVVGLLHRDVLNPDAALCLHDSLDESSHKHAFAVSTDLKHGARIAIELLANEVVHYKREVAKDKVFEKEELAAQLTSECLVYLYRLLFLFYVEARGGELGVTPMKSDAYRLGYSLEGLRDLELVPLATPEAQNGFFIHHSLERLFQIVNRGFPTTAQVAMKDTSREFGETFEHGSFSISGLRSALFDADRTPLLRSVKLRNRVLQEVIERLSLSKGGDRRRGRGRISYAQLGINQLGAVYEGLLAYRGFFAQQDLFEVKAKTEMNDPEARSFFVGKADLDEYEDDEIVRSEDGKRKVFPKGTYVFRLAGRDREKSASYYTPEVLTRCLTKYTLKERLEGVSADEILKLTVLEPAMGSGAFLTEAVNQLADAYLERKQKELGQTIGPEAYPLERQKVKAYITSRNVYGVDLNPLAAELGKISLWLNTLHPGARAPYLDARIAVGNSLIGARREVFPTESLLKKTKSESRWTSLVPTAVPLGAERPRDAVYHFLLPDEGMVPFDSDKVVKELEPQAVKAIKAWRKKILEPYTQGEVDRLVRISDRIDRLWAEHIEARAGFLEEIAPPQEVWGQPPPKDRPWSAETCEELARLRLGHLNAAAKRIVAVMDYWCALWFWPLSEADSLPDRSAWLDDIEAILEDLREARERSSVKVALARSESLHFHHWGLCFPEVFTEGAGFDVILGNPPWLKLQWNEQGILGDHQPLLAIRGLSAKESADRRAGVFALADARRAYLEDFEGLMGIKAFVGALQNEPLLQGIQANLYKVFITRAWRIGSIECLVGLLHQGGVFEDAAGAELRKALARRLELAARCKNQLKLFEGVHHERPFAFTVSRASEKQAIAFQQISNLFHPKTLDESLAHDGHGAVPGIKDDQDNWDLRGHSSRIVEVNEEALALFASLYDEPGTPALEARLPILHSREIMGALKKIGSVPRLGAPGALWGASREWHEGDRTKDGTLVATPGRQPDNEEVVLSGPQIAIGNPLFKSPREGCRNNGDYDCVDLATIAPDFVPRVNFRLDVNAEGYRKKRPIWGGSPIFDRYRVANRDFLSLTGERSLYAAIIPPGFSTVHSLFYAAFDDLGALVEYAAFAMSIEADFYLRTTGSQHAGVSVVARLPARMGGSAELRDASVARVLRLNCLTKRYSDLWLATWPRAAATESWSRNDPRMSPWSRCGREWTPSAPLRREFERRLALVELDCLVALAIGLSVEELIAIHQLQFPVLQQYERETFYDGLGRVVFTVNKGLNGVGLSRAEWEEVRGAQAGDKLPEFASAFLPPFDRCDRETDLRQAYAFFRPLLDGKPAGSGGRA